MNDYILQTGDVVKLGVYEKDYQEEIDKIILVTTELTMFQKPSSMAAMKKHFVKIGVNVTDIVDETFYISLADGTEISIDRGSDKVTVEKKAELDVFGFIVDYCGHPFIAYHDGEDVVFTPYKAIVDKIESIHRHRYTEDATFRLQLSQGFIMQDVVAALSGEYSNYGVARDFTGNTGLNYIFIILGLMGVPFPADWAEYGVPTDILEKYEYGFIKVK